MWSPKDKSIHCWKIGWRGIGHHRNELTEFYNTVTAVRVANGLETAFKFEFNLLSIHMLEFKIDSRIEKNSHKKVSAVIWFKVKGMEPTIEVLSIHLKTVE